MNDFFAAVEFLMSRERTTGKVGITGFCYGGGVANAAAVAYPELAAAVPFYGRQPTDAEVARIRAPLLLHYAAQDERVNAGWPAYEAALKAQHTVYQAYVYPGTNHGFHNDSTPRYDKAAATLTWDRTIEWFRRHRVSGSVRSWWCRRLRAIGAQASVRPDASPGRGAQRGRDDRVWRSARVGCCSTQKTPPFGGVFLCAHHYCAGGCWQPIAVACNVRANPLCAVLRHR
ncbi:dienelactone hydrolase family protein [Xanthomonas campestris]|uniref:dienelactone hydrolase family protein n=4 Tax=Xanthomonas campestris TaxID=339 RepID=UPI0023519C1B|nr:dienelactone hydrolase family protein [Xanthomonas campestris]